MAEVDVSSTRGEGTEPTDSSALSLSPDKPPEETPTSSTRLRPLWRSPDFMKFWAGQSISKLGDQFAFFALPLLLLQLTHSPLALGAFTAASLAPYLLLGLPAGALIDRLPRRRVMIICDVARMGILTFEAASVITHLLTPATAWLLYVATALYAVATIFFDMGYLSALPNLVEKPQLLAGNSYLQASSSTAQLAGPTLAGLVFQALGAGFALLIDGFSFLASIISLGLIPRTFRAAPTSGTPSPETPSPAKRSLMREIGEGLRYVWNEPVLRWMMLLLAVFNTTPAFPLGIFRMREQLHFSAEILGLISACGAAGGIAGSFLTARFRRWFGLVPTILIGVTLWSLLSMSYALSLPPWVFMIVEALSGICLVAINITVFTLRQSIAPDRLLGRVQSVSRLIAWSLTPLGTLIWTALALPLGASTILITSGALGMLVALTDLCIGH